MIRTFSSILERANACLAAAFLALLLVPELAQVAGVDLSQVGIRVAAALAVIGLLRQPVSQLAFRSMVRENVAMNIKRRAMKKNKH